MDQYDPLLVPGQTASGYASQDGSEYFGDVSLIERYQPDDAPVSIAQSAPCEIQIPSTDNASQFVSQTAKNLGKRKASDSDVSIDSASSMPALKKMKALDVKEEPVNGPVYIAHCPNTLKLIESRNLTWGVKFEIARLISKGALVPKDVTAEKLDLLRGNNKDIGPRVAGIFANSSAQPTGVEKVFAQELAANSPWEELDREEAALSLDPYAGLGNNPDLPGWYGGKVEFCGQLQKDGKKYKIVLDSCALGASSRFTRRFGSWSFLRVRVPQSIFFGNDRDFILFFLRPFVIWGRVFRVFDAKRGNVFLYWTNEAYLSGSPISSQMSFEGFIDWHNPLEENKNQLMTKWAARMCLGLSNSVPGPRLLQTNILAESDIVSDTGSDMTDGCGLSSKNIHTYLSHMLSLSMAPTAFQFRLAGFKGMSLLDCSESSNEEHRAWFRPSQTKIKYPSGMKLDPAILTFDILRTSHMTSPAQLSTEVIINLAENGVPSEVFVRLLKDSIRTIVAGLTTWDCPDAMFTLWKNVERAGGVISGRKARESVGEARVRGYSSKSPDEVDLEREDDEDDEDVDGKIGGRRSTAWWTDYISGCPSCLEETVLVLLDAGFEPQTCPMLRDKLEKVVISKIENRMQKVRFEVEESCTAFAVPDPYGVLGEDEVQIKSSKRNLKTNDGLLTDTILGDVLVTRNPCKVPTDVRKVKAVDHPSLRNLVDVVVFSVKGKRRLIDFLAGGDYDGDKVLVLWKYGMVVAFQNADEKHASEPQGLEHGFERDQEDVATFLKRTALLEPEGKIREMQRYLLGPLVDPALVGMYSNMHINAIYQEGYSHPRVVKLAYKFCRILDAPKTGWRVKSKSYQGDLKMYIHNHRGPKWKEAIGRKNSKAKVGYAKDTSNMLHLERNLDSPYAKDSFIMDILVKAAEKEKNRLTNEMRKVFAPLPPGPDPHLLAPWNKLVDFAEYGSPAVVDEKKRELAKIITHVEEAYRVHKRLVQSDWQKSNKSKFTMLPIEERQDRLRKVSSLFVSGPPIGELRSLIVDEAQLARCRASYAYQYDAKQGKQGWSRFPFNVAMRELCAIKAAALGPHKVVANSFYERFKLFERR